jgi:NADH dehydrogenase [ubiquinone] 1 alpha subcomplex assembly factor 7
MTQLAEALCARIAAEGPLTWGQFMEAALYHPTWGYYTRGLNFLETPPRDFITAPELTPVFGMVVARWVFQQWELLGQPAQWQLVEAGPGRGVLLRDVWHALPEHCRTGAQVRLMERSAVLRGIQRETLVGIGHAHCADFAALADLPTLVLANELLDAMPVEQFRWDGATWRQRLVGMDGPDLVTQWEACDAPTLPTGWQPAAGARVEGKLEVSAAMAGWVAGLREFLERVGGAALLLDYGFAELPPVGGDTLQAMRAHRFVNLLTDPGEVDMTAHVPFDRVQAWLGAEACMLTDLAPWLMAHGIVEVALANVAQADSLQRLLHPGQMGQLFKVLAYFTEKRQI